MNKRDAETYQKEDLVERGDIYQGASLHVDDFLSPKNKNDGFGGINRTQEKTNIL